MFEGNGCEELEPKDIPCEYYDLLRYASKERMLAYWHQTVEIVAKKPSRILDIGIGPAIVAGIIKRYGVEVVTADINPALNPDFVIGVTELDKCFGPGQFPFVLCARVLQHLPFDQFERALSQLVYVTNDCLLLTLPVESLCLYIRLRITGTGAVTFAIPFPLFLKRILLRLLFRTEPGPKKQNFWKINSSPRTSMRVVRKAIEKYFDVEKAYRIPEDRSRAFFVLRKKHNRAPAAEPAA